MFVPFCSFIIFQLLLPYSFQCSTSSQGENSESLQFSCANPNKMTAPPLVALEFEVFGKVQGVFFRKYTEAKARQLGLRGWCENTQKGTVQGVLEGNPSKIEKMKLWLHSEGSPKSKISTAEFRNEKPLPNFTFPSFEIRK